MHSSTRTETSASNKEHTLLLQNQAKRNLFHLTQPGVPFFMIKAFTSSKAKCEFLAFQRKALPYSFNKRRLPPPQESQFSFSITRDH